MSLGNTAGANQEHPPSTPAIERVWELGGWQNKPIPYFVRSRTAKTLTVEKDSEHSRYKTRVLTSEIGTKWYTSEEEAWVALYNRAKNQVDVAKGRLQQLRTELGMVESELKRRGFDVDDGQNESATSGTAK